MKGVNGIKKKKKCCKSFAFEKPHNSVDSLNVYHGSSLLKNSTPDIYIYMKKKNPIYTNDIIMRNLLNIVIKKKKAFSEKIKNEKKSLKKKKNAGSSMFSLPPIQVTKQTRFIISKLYMYEEI